MSIQTMRLAIAVVGMMVWGYAYRVENDRVRWVGIAMLAVSVLMRFIPRRKPTSPAQE